MQAPSAPVVLHEVRADEDASPAQAGFAVDREASGLRLGDLQPLEQYRLRGARPVGEVQVVVPEAALGEAAAVIDLKSERASVTL